jgi:hypothetical protein
MGHWHGDRDLHPNCGGERCETFKLIKGRDAFFILREPRSSLPLEQLALDAPGLTMYYTSAGRVAQLAERWPYKPEVTGSSPVPPTLRRLQSIVLQ